MLKERFQKAEALLSDLREKMRLEQRLKSESRAISQFDAMLKRAALKDAATQTDAAAIPLRMEPKETSNFSCQAEVFVVDGDAELRFEAAETLDSDSYAAVEAAEEADSQDNICPKLTTISEHSDELDAIQFPKIEEAFDASEIAPKKSSGHGGFKSVKGMLSVRREVEKSRGKIIARASSRDAPADGGEMKSSNPIRPMAVAPRLDSRNLPDRPPQRSSWQGIDQEMQATEHVFERGTSPVAIIEQQLQDKRMILLSESSFEWGLFFEQGLAIDDLRGPSKRNEKRQENEGEQEPSDGLLFEGAPPIPAMDIDIAGGESLLHDADIDAMQPVRVDLSRSIAKQEAGQVKQRSHRARNARRPQQIQCLDQPVCFSQAVQVANEVSESFSQTEGKKLEEKSSGTHTASHMRPASTQTIERSLIALTSLVQRPTSTLSAKVEVIIDNDFKSTETQTEEHAQTVQIVDPRTNPIAAQQFVVLVSKISQTDEFFGNDDGLEGRWRPATNEIQVQTKETSFEGDAHAKAFSERIEPMNGSRAIGISSSIGPELSAAAKESDVPNALLTDGNLLTSRGPTAHVRDVPLEVSEDPMPQRTERKTVERPVAAPFVPPQNATGDFKAKYLESRLLLTQLTSQKARVEDELHVTQKQLQSEIKEVQKLRNELIASNGRCSELEEELTSGAEELSKAQAECLELGDQIVGLEAELTDKSAECGHLREALECLEFECTRLNQDLDLTRKECNELTERFEASDGILHEWKVRCQDLEGALEASFQKQQATAPTVQRLMPKMYMTRSCSPISELTDFQIQRSDGFVAASEVVEVGEVVEVEICNRFEKIPEPNDSTRHVIDKKGERSCHSQSTQTALSFTKSGTGNTSPMARPQTLQAVSRTPRPQSLQDYSWEYKEDWPSPERSDLGSLERTDAAAMKGSGKKRRQIVTFPISDVSIDNRLPTMDPNAQQSKIVYRVPAHCKFQAVLPQSNNLISKWESSALIERLLAEIRQPQRGPISNPIESPRRAPKLMKTMKLSLFEEPRFPTINVSRISEAKAIAQETQKQIEVQMRQENRALKSRLQDMEMSVEWLLEELAQSALNHKQMSPRPTNFQVVNTRALPIGSYSERRLFHVE